MREATTNSSEVGCPRAAHPGVWEAREWVSSALPASAAIASSVGQSKEGGLHGETSTADSYRWGWRTSPPRFCGQACQILRVVFSAHANCLTMGCGSAVGAVLEEDEHSLGKGMTKYTCFSGSHGWYIGDRISCLRRVLFEGGNGMS